MENNDELMESSNPALQEVEYAGFWIRFLAVILDTVLLLVISVPLLLIIYGPGVFFTTESPGLLYDVINLGLPVAGFLVFWHYKAADPGKLMMGVYIVDADTLGQPSFGRLVLRYIGYYISALPLLLGFFWAAFDKRKQGFHDKIARTVVIKMPSGSQEKPVIEEVVDPVIRKESASQDPWKE